MAPRKPKTSFPDSASANLVRLRRHESVHTAAVDHEKDAANIASVASGAKVSVPFNAAFPIVGIGASAGGLEAFEAFFHACPPDTGIQLAAKF